MSRKRGATEKQDLEDARLMRKALAEARRGRGKVWPNPMVGAVVVRAQGQGNRQRMISRGHHPRVGEPHAEIMALRRAGKEARGATIYVSLEPCAHQGRTPPCADALIKAGVARVVFAHYDPNPAVAGRGAERLRAAGIEVRAGILGTAARRLNEVFIHTIRSGRPFVILKSATTLDGAVATATGHSQWITSAQSRRRVHGLRRDAGAVLVGVGTMLADDPSLTVRHVPGPSPLRIVLDSSLRAPLDAQLCNELARGTIFACLKGADAAKAAELEARGAQIWRLPKDEEGRVDLKALLARAAEDGLASILVEGGTSVFTTFLRAGLVDKISAFVAPRILGGGQALIHDLGLRRMDEALKLADVRVSQVGPDALVEGYTDPYFDSDPAAALAQTEAEG